MSSSGGSGAPGSRTLLFGGSGFLGSALLAQNPNLISVGRTRPANARRHVGIETIADLRALRDVEFDSVAFIIGHSDHYALEKFKLEPGEPNAFDYHVTPLIHALEQLKHYPIRKFLHFSTVLLYDWRRATIPVDENGPVDPYSTRYVLSKHMAEEACTYYSSSVPIINVRLGNMYGPSRRERYDLIYLLISQILRSGSATLWSTRTSRDFVHVDDVARAVLQLLDSDYTGTVNIGSGTMTRVSQVVEILRNLSGATIHDEDRPVEGPAEFRCDVSRLKSIVQWEPEYSIESGLRQTYETMRDWANEVPA